MNLPHLAVSRHVLAACLSLVIALVGLIAYGRLGVDRNPNIDVPTLTISTTLPGAAPATVSRTVTEPLESRLNTISGVDTMSSTSTTGRSTITVNFVSDKNMAEALNDVQARLNQARRDLPSDADAPVVQKFDPNLTPTMWLTLTAPELSGLELTALAKRVQKRLETLDGVGEVQVRGETERTLYVTVNERELASLNLGVNEIQAAFAARHLNTAVGRLRTEGREYQVEADFELNTPELLATLAVAQRGERTVRLAEIAHIEEGPAATRSLARFNGEPVVALGIVKSSGANPVTVIDRVRARMDEVQATLPAGAKLDVMTDEGKPIRAMVGALQSHLLEGTLLTALIVWLFLKSVRATGIVATAIPVSLLGAVASLYIAGYTFNSFTLLALLLLIGVVVDDAIVVLENIYRIREEDPTQDREAAASHGAQEVLFAVMASTLTLVCVFGPVVFLPGIMGQFFKSFAVTVVVGVLVSWFVSLTLTPMLCAKFLRVAGEPRGVYRWFERGFQALDGGYRRVLAMALAWPKLVLLVAFATLVPAGWLLSIAKTEFIPVVDEGRLSVSLSLPSGHGRERIEALAREAEALVRATPDVRGMLTSFFDGGRSGSDALSLTLVLDEGRSRGQAAVMRELQDRLKTNPAWRAQVTPASSMGGGPSGAPLTFYLLGPDYASLTETAESLQATLMAAPGLSNLRNNLNTGLPQLAVQLDTTEIARLGISARDVATALATLTGQTTLGRYTAADGERHDIVLRAKAGLTPQGTGVFEQMKVRTRTGDFVPLSSVIRTAPQGAPAALQRVNQQFAVTYFGNPQVSMGEALATVRQAADALPAGYSIEFAGQAKELQQTGGNLAMVFGLALVLLYFVLASQFNSYGQPLIVMLAQPLAVIGGIGALVATGQTLNIYSVIGLVLLVGLVAKNSILLVDRTNQLLAHGYGVADALRQACPERLRPVLMTSLTVMLAMFPAALGLGAGAENNQPLAIAIIGGMASSTLLTLGVVPAAYSLFVRRGERKA
jgi:HAE1 family hydrophobic/amphiphilic exporter-1